MENIEVIVLAAGQGSRMRSALPKVLHSIGGKPMLAHVLDCAEVIQPTAKHVVVGHGGDRVKESFASAAVNWVEQREQLGTGHAVQQVRDAFSGSNGVIILYGDVPLITDAIVQQLAEALEHSSVAVLSTILADASGYGRIVRSASGSCIGIVEHKDASPSELAINEVNTGLMAVRDDAYHLLAEIDNDNAQQEFYLTDLVGLAVAKGLEVAAIVTEDADAVGGVNNRIQQAAAERIWQGRQVARLMKCGATVLDPSRLDVRGRVCVGQDVTIDVNVVFEGEVKLANDVTIGANCVLRNCSIGAGSQIKPFSHIDGAVLAERVHIGPYARLREGTSLAAGAKIGNFVETKKAQIGEGSKISHLSYIGDAEVAAEVNIGAGTITCNYDGVNKFKTTIGKGAFIGSGTQLVAPIEIGAEATIGAGSTIRKNAPAGKLTLTKGRSQTVDGWSRPNKIEK